jgi:type I restriction enzyme, R subunit
LDDANFWTRVSPDKIDFLRGVVKPLFRTVAGGDFKAMRFEKDIVEVSLAHLANEKDKFETLKESIIEEIGELPLSVNVVAREEQLIRSSQNNNFWATINEQKFDELIEKLCPLMYFRESLIVPLGPAKFNLQDTLHAKEYVDFGPNHESLSVAKYRELVEQKINELVSNNPLLQKLKNGFDITEKEAEVLATELYNEHPHITVDLLRKVYSHRKAQLVQFIKHILGIKILESFPETVSKSFDVFFAAHSYLNSQQLDFLNLLRMFLIEKGGIEKKDLISAPFTRVHPDGIRGLFTNKEIEEIISFTQQLAA